MRQMQSYFNRMIVIRLLQNRLRLGLRPGPRWESLRRSPRPSNRNCLGALRPRLARKIGFSADRPSGPRSFETHFFGPRPKVFKEHCISACYVHATLMHECMLCTCNINAFFLDEF